VLNLALFFAWYVLWPKGFAGGVDALAAILALASGWAPIRFQLGVIPLLATCAAIGLATRVLLLV
jgi:chromate transporter